MNLFTQHKQTHRRRKETYGCQRGKGEGGIHQEFGIKICTLLYIYIKYITRDFPGVPVVKNLPANAGDVGSIPGRGTKIPHAAEQLSPCLTTTELSRFNEKACVPQTTEPTHAPWSPHVTTREKPEHCNEEPARLQQQKRSHVPQQRSCAPQLRPDVAKK